MKEKAIRARPMREKAMRAGPMAAMWLQNIDRGVYHKEDMGVVNDHWTIAP